MSGVNKFAGMPVDDPIGAVQVIVRCGSTVIAANRFIWIFGAVAAVSVMMLLSVTAFRIVLILAALPAAGITLTGHYQNAAADQEAGNYLLHNEWKRKGKLSKCANVIIS